MEPITSPVELLRWMEMRDIYQTRHGWRLSHMPTRPIAESAVHILQVQRDIRPRYSNTTECLTVRQTIDVERTLEWWKNHPRHEHLYVEYAP